MGDGTMLDGILKWLKENGWGVTSLSLFVVALIIISFASHGCSWDPADFVQVQVPPEVQRDVKAPKTVTLNEAEDLYIQWENFVTNEFTRRQNELKQWAQLKEVTSSRFNDRIDKGWAFANVIGSAISMTLDSAKGSAATVPGGLAAVGLIGTLVGAMGFNKPGTNRRIQREKEKSFEEAQRRSEQSMMSVLALNAGSGSSAADT